MFINRRQALAGMSSALLLPTATASVDVANEVFEHGVASGDPDQHSVVLWTRVSGQSGSVSLDWVVATDRAMRHVVSGGQTQTSVAQDYTVKVFPQGLPSGQTLYFQFSVNGIVSPVGRTRTLPVGDVDQWVFAVASCSNYPFGCFNGYQAIADDPDVDAVIHLGDYFYEYGADSYGAAEGRRLNRVHEPPHETVTLSDYRQRHAQYKRDAGSLAMHARHPLIPTWDDHESANNPYKDGAQNHQEDEGAWPDRRSVSLRAYYEWMPVREPALGEPLEQRRAHLSIGNLASVFAVETRHMARSKQIELSEYQEEVTTPEAAARFYDQVVGAPNRQMMSFADERYLAAGLAQSVAQKQRWRILANQIILANVVSPDLRDPVFQNAVKDLDERSKRLAADLTAVGTLSLPSNMDAWDGYPAARSRLYALAAEAGARDLLVLTGDTHVFWQNRLLDDKGAPAGLELGTSGITSPRGFGQLGEVAMNRFDALTAAQNDSVDWADGRYRGYIKLTLQQERAVAQFIALSTIESRMFSTKVVREVEIVPKEGSLDYRNG
ncbi:MAG: alkaline phosphatase D family protein [Pseudomonadota bacterium]